MTKEAIEKSISEMPEYVPIRIIERKLGMPKTTLQKVLKGGRELPKKWIKPLEAYLARAPGKKDAGNPGAMERKAAAPPVIAKNAPPMPKREDFADNWEFIGAKNNWKKLYNP